jgi:hypothetical protein
LPLLPWTPATRVPVMVLPILILALFFSALTDEPALRETVAVFWPLMAKGDKAAALKYVEEESLNNFISRKEPKIQNWRVVEVKLQSEMEAQVTVEVEGLYPGMVGLQKVLRHDTWIRTAENGWKLRVGKASMERISRLFEGERATRALPEVLEIRPEAIRISFIDSSQVGFVFVVNGTTVPVELVSVKYDEARFELVEAPRRVEPGQKASFKIRYKAVENEKNLRSQVTFVLKQGNQEKLYQIPVFYNYLTRADRGLFGLTEEQADALKHGERLTPVIGRPGATNGRPTKPGNPVPSDPAGSQDSSVPAPKEEPAPSPQP